MVREVKEEVKDWPKHIVVAIVVAITTLTVNSVWGYFGKFADVPERLQAIARNVEEMKATYSLLQQRVDGVVQDEAKLAKEHEALRKVYPYTIGVH